jgi:hypothetical protein
MAETVCINIANCQALITLANGLLAIYHPLPAKEFPSVPKNPPEDSRAGLPLLFL